MMTGVIKLPWWVALPPVIIFISLQLISEAGELRFCYYGPQRVQYKDCPGGFIAKKAFNATCIYYYKAEGAPNMAAIFSDNVCDASHSRELDRDFQDFQDNEFQMIQFTDIDEEMNDTSGSDPAMDKCNETCLAEWMDVKHWDPVQIFMDKPVVNESEADEIAKEYVELTKLIMIRIINEDEYEDEEENEVNPSENGGGNSAKLDILKSNETTSASFPMPGLMKLLAKSMRVMFSKCEPFVETSFYTLVFRTMQEFRRMNNNFPIMNVVPLKRILKLLERCEAKPNNLFAFNGTACDEKFVVQTITNLQTKHTFKYKPMAESFRWGRYDPIIEAAWSAVDFVHGFCFDIFSEDMLHYSLFIKAMIEVFVQPIVEQHWANPAPVGKGMTLWEMAYDTPDLKNQLRSLDACIIGAYQNSIFTRRLERPFTSEEQLKDPQYIDDPEIPQPGWNKSVEEYWKIYEKRGFKDMVTELGHCVQTPQDFNGTLHRVIEESCERQKPTIK